MCGKTEKKCGKCFGRNSCNLLFVHTKFLFNKVFIDSFFEIDQATNKMKFQLEIGAVEAAIFVFQNGETFHVADNPFYFGAHRIINSSNFAVVCHRSDK